MNKNKFRGKDIETREWIYGDLIHNYDNYIKDNKCLVDDMYRGWRKVDDATVGQFIGLKDKNNKEIYEGDVIKFSDKLHGYIDFKEGKFIVVHIDLNLPIKFKNCGIYLNCYEVVDNIHDNLKMLKKKYKNVY